MIPKAGDQIEFAGFGFTVLEVEDNRRVTSLLAAPLANAPSDPQTSSVGVSGGMDSTGGGVARGSHNGHHEEGASATLEHSEEEPLSIYPNSSVSLVTVEVSASGGENTPPSPSPLLTDSSQTSTPPPSTPSASQSQQENDVLIFRDGEWQDSTTSVDR